MHDHPFQTPSAQYLIPSSLQGRRRTIIIPQVDRTPRIPALHILPLDLLNDTSNRTRLDPDEDAHDEEHEECVENPHEHLVAEQVPRISQRELDDSEDRTNKNKCAGYVERVEVALPGEINCEDARGWNLEHAHVEDGGYGDEDAKDYDLDYETTNDDVSTGESVSMNHRW